jgi:hypothetical protein
MPRITFSLSLIVPFRRSTLEFKPSCFTLTERIFIVRRNDHHHQMLLLARAMEVINGREQVTTFFETYKNCCVKLKLA